MQYENRIVCFFDILGFGNKVKSEEINVAQIDSLFNEIDSIIGEYRNDNPQNGIQISHFSDSILISILSSATNSPTQFRFIIEILIKLLEFGFVARGAMTCGKLFHDSQKIYGPALVCAVELEKTSIYPWIVLDKNLNHILLPTIGNKSICFIDFFKDFIYIKEDEKYGNKIYIDIIGEIKKRSDSLSILEKLDKIIENGLESNDEKIIKKYKWLKEKRNTI